VPNVTTTAPAPLWKGVGGWEADTNARRIMRPKLPFQPSLEHAATAKRAADKAALGKLSGDIRFDFEPYWRAVYVNTLRSLNSPSWEALRRMVWERDGGLCRRCGEPGSDVDHVHERHLGGADCLENLALLCRFCHYILKPIVEGWASPEGTDAELRAVIAPIVADAEQNGYAPVVARLRAEHPDEAAFVAAMATVFRAIYEPTPRARRAAGAVRPSRAETAGSTSAAHAAGARARASVSP